MTDYTQISIVVPVFNEETGLREFHQRVTAVLDRIALAAEIIYVNDGSSDQSLEVMLDLARSDMRVAVVSLSRNFGKEIALTAGLDHVRTDAAVVIDSDLQDPPELIPTLIDKWKEGFDVVYARRNQRDGETLTKRATAAAFYKLMGLVGDVRLPENVGDFRLIDRRCLDALATCRERHRFMKGLFTWIGFRQTEVLYNRDSRFAGETKWNYWRLWNLAIEGITSFTISPLRLASYLGLVVATIAFIYGGVIVIKTLVLGRDLPGYPSLMTVILFLGGVQLVALGVIGEYVGRIFDETKNRPLYLLESYTAPRAPHLHSRPPSLLGVREWLGPSTE